MPGTFDFELRPGEPTEIADSADSIGRAREFRDVMGWYASGVTIVTAQAGGQAVGLTCQTFSSVSLDPPLVSFMPAKTSRSWPLMHEAGHFCVNILRAGQEDLAMVFASKGADKFAGVGFRHGITGAPILDGTLGYVECAIEDVHEAGDHHIVVGRVLGLAGVDAGEPLLYFRGAFGLGDA